MPESLPEMEVSYVMLVTLFSFDIIIKDNFNYAEKDRKEGYERQLASDRVTI